MILLKVDMLDDDDSSGSASSDSTSEEDIKPSEDVRNTVCMLQNNSKLFL